MDLEEAEILPEVVSSLILSTVISTLLPCLSISGV